METTEPKSILKKQVSFLFALSFLVLFATLVGLLFILALSQNKPARIENDVITSYPISYQNSLLQTETTNYIFNNIDKFEATKITNYYPDCGGVSYPSSEVNFIKYLYKPEEESILRVDNISYIIALNPSEYINSNDSLRNTYSTLELLFTNQLTVETSPSYASYTGFRPRSCSGEQVIPLGYLKKISYPGADVAYLLIFFGSNQSTVSSRYFPLQILILSKINTDYGLLSTSGDYTLISKSNTLGECETASNSGAEYIDIFSEAGKECAIQKTNEDLNEDKLNVLVNELLTIFSLKQ